MPPIPPGSIPETMIAIEITRPGGPEVLRAVERKTPRPGDDEVLIKVAAAGVNRPDLMQREGKYPPPPGASDIPGLEVAGWVAAAGRNATGWREGQEVCALLAGGGYAEYCVAPASQCLPVPRSLDLISAAALPEACFTVWSTVFDRAHLAAGETLLVHGGSSGIGTTAIQLGAAFGARVFATAGSAEKCAACERLGAERAVNYHEQDFVGTLLPLTNGRGIDVILDMVGGSYLARNIALLALEGRLVQIAILGGGKGELDLVRLLRQRLTITGSTLRSRTVEQKGRLARALERHVWPRIEAGSVRPVIYRQFSLKDGPEAHRLMAAGHHIGKLVLVP